MTAIDWKTRQVDLGASSVIDRLVGTVCGLSRARGLNESGTLANVSKPYTSTQGESVGPEGILPKALIRHLLLKRDEVVILDVEAGIECLGWHISRGSGCRK